MMHPDDMARYDAQREEVLRADKPVRFEYRITSATGEAKHLLANLMTQRDEAGTPIALFGIVEDITQQKRQQELLIKAQSIARMAAGRPDFQTGQAKWSDEYFRLVGDELQAFEATKENFALVVHPDDFDHIWNGMMALARRPGPFATDYRVLRPDGSMVVLVSRGRVLVDAEGRAAQDHRHRPGRHRGAPRRSRAAGRQGGRRGRQPGQEPVPRQH